MTLDEIQARADAAVGDGYRATPWRLILNTAGDRYGVVSADGCVVTTADKHVAELLAHAPADISALLKALRAVEAVADEANDHGISPDQIRTAIREGLGQ